MRQLTLFDKSAENDELLPVLAELCDSVHGLLDILSGFEGFTPDENCAIARAANALLDAEELGRRS